MCGITGWVAFKQDLREHRPMITAMTDTMASRGPDGDGTYLDAHVALGHRRLAIIDLPGGTQPLVERSRDGEVALVYSGEVYNFEDLRAELTGRGHRFRTHCDTEVVLRGYLEWGTAVAERLNGMYAFAIWDGRSDALVMIRDRMGVKPLYYYPTADGALFGSEPKTILANPAASRKVTLEGFRELFAFIKTPGHAIWDGMAEVQPGTVVTVDANGIRTRTYWSLDTHEHGDDRDHTVAHIRDLLDDIVRRQLVADVPTCTLLSGGLDSSAMTAIAAAQAGERGDKVRSFSVDFAGLTDNFVPNALRSTPDTPFVHDVAAKAGTIHHDIVLSNDDIADPEIRKAAIKARDFPSGLGDLDQSLYLLLREIKRHATVALTGESADELFGGYRQFFDPQARKGQTFPWLANGHQFFGRGTTDRVDHSLLTAGFEAALALPAYIQDSYHDAVQTVQRLPGESDTEWRMRKISYLHLTRFVRIWLDRKDRISMAFGLEVRVPFCDHRLVEYVYNAPWALKSFDGREKSLLRAAASDVLPQSVLDRTKAPYPTPQDPGYAAALRAQCTDLLTDPTHPVFDIIDNEALRQAVKNDTPLTDQASRRNIERALDLATWIDLYNPTLEMQ